MTITLNGNYLEDWNKISVICENIKENIKETKNLDFNFKQLNKINNNDFAVKILFAAGAMSVGDLSGLEEVIRLFQEFAYYVALGYSTWGLIEYSADHPNGLNKVKRCIGAYIGIFVIPVVFKAIKNALG